MTAACAGGESVSLDRPSFAASQSASITAVVEAINHETRVVTVRKQDGEAVTFTVREEARNLGQVEVGDVLMVEYEETMTVEVIADDGMGTEEAEMLAMARAKEGDMPGFAAMDTRVVIASVENINVEANTFALKFPDGSVNEYTARDPDNLHRAIVGDLVVITFTEAIAVIVEHQESEQQ
ncbi:MAG: hypothetical protein O2907_06915 [Proteobacteria bacterium]|nr:hypothetical protein [Pseudomonadota bacterium]MDA1064046.1 hypothetical protein [Pseudomonadota bacterium]